MIRFHMKVKNPRQVISHGRRIRFFVGGKTDQIVVEISRAC